MAALPTVGSDTDAWGTELNTYLLISHNADGTIKVSGGVGTLGSVPFIGAAGAISQDNANFFYDSTNHVLRGPIIAGGSGTTSALVLRSTTGVGATGADIIFQTGNNGATEAVRILNSGDVKILGSVGIGGTPNRQLHLIQNEQPTLAFSDTRGATGTQEMCILYDAGTALSGHPGMIIQKLTDAGGFVSNQHVLWQDGALSFGSILYPGAAFRSTFAGNVGINSSTPTHWLQLGTDDAAKPTTNTWTIVSDKRTKEQVEPYRDGLDILRKLEPKTFVYNGLGGTVAGDRGVGFLAQDMAPAAPSMFSSRLGKLEPEAELETEIHEYNGHNLVFMLLNAALELDARLAKLEGLA
jgi:hypothetical protein